MLKIKHFLNLALGGLSSYAYTISLGYVVAFTPIRPSSFLIGECGNAPRTDLTDTCRLLNFVGLLSYDFVHFLFISVVLATVIGTFHDFFMRKWLPYSFAFFSSGFLAVWAVTMILAFESSFPSSWYILSVWVLELSIFLGVYHLTETHVFKTKSPDKLSEPTP